MTPPAPPLKRLLPALARAYLGFALRTTRWRVVGPHSGIAVLTQSSTVEKPGAIVAFWHRNLLLLPALWTWARRKNASLRLNVLISRNKDGRLISETVAPWDIIGIEGSSNKEGRDKGGARALRAGVSALKGGALLAITPDGPRGPAEHVQSGTQALGRLSGRYVVAVGGCTHCLRLPSWDRMRIPLPFGRGFLCFSAQLPPDTSPERLAKEISRADHRAQQAWHASRTTLPDRLWSMIGFFLQPFLRSLTARRLARGKELPGRTVERRGLPTKPRPDGNVIWLHAASVGEVKSILPFLTFLSLHWRDAHVLLTTATRTGAETFNLFLAEMEEGLSKRFIHQFAPYDVGPWTKNFFDHWQPAALLLTESEIWPGWLHEAGRRGIPTGLLNARMSAHSFRRWSRVKVLSKSVLSRLTFVAARNEVDVLHFKTLGAGDVFCAGDLKAFSPPPEISTDALAALKDIVGIRPIFLAASTHPGEDEIIVKAARRAQKVVPALLCIIVPRHPERGEDIARLGTPAYPRRSKGESPRMTDSIWIADTLGELGLFYRVADAIIIGNSLLPGGGGHNPYEALHSNAACATGPYRENFREAFATLEDRITTLSTAEDLGRWVSTAVLRDPTGAHFGWKQACDITQDFDRLSRQLLARVGAMTGL